MSAFEEHSVGVLTSKYLTILKLSNILLKTLNQKMNLGQNFCNFVS